VRNQGGGANSPAAVLGEIPAIAWAGVAGEELGELPGGGVKLMQGLAGAGVRRSGWSTVEQEARCSGARRPVVLGVRGGCSAAVGHREG
jgi:hypothetical protein